LQKTRKRSDSPPSNLSRSSRRYSASLPEVVSVDVLGTMLDEDLLIRFRALDDDRIKVTDAKGDPRPWEVEIAYLRREQQLRYVRRDAHAKYVRKEQEWFDQSEMGLPPGDFDNSAFVYAATGGRPRWN
jgi:hypothetical protein